MSKQEPTLAKNPLQQAFCNNPKELRQLIETFAIHGVTQIAIVKEDKTWVINYVPIPA